MLEVTGASASSPPKRWRSSRKRRFAAASYAKFSAHKAHRSPSSAFDDPLAEVENLWLYGC